MNPEPAAAPLPLQLFPSEPCSFPVILGMVLGLLASLSLGWISLALLHLWFQPRPTAATSPRSPFPLPPLASLAFSLILGPMILGFLALLLLWADLPLHPLWPWIFLLFPFLLATKLPPPLPTLFPRPRPLPLDQILTFALLILLAAVVAFLALTRPTTDYDGIAIWSYRTRVLISEKTFWTPSLLETLRLVPMREHPYLLPATEALWSVGGGAGFSWMAHRAPALTMILGWLLLSTQAPALLRWPRTFHLPVTIALAAIPAILFGPWTESAREPLIGILAGTATLAFALFLRLPHQPFLAALALLAMALAHNLKVEGTPPLLGLILALFFLPLLNPKSLPLHQAIRLSLLLLILILPWLIIRQAIPPGPHGYALTTGIATGWTQRGTELILVFWLILTDLFLRPEIFGLSLLLTLTLLWQRHQSATSRSTQTFLNTRHFLRPLLPLLPALLLLAAILAIYTVRQDQLPAERNVTLTRRLFALFPSLLIGLLAYPTLSKSKSPSFR